MTQIDWSKKPEGYPLWLKDLNPCTGGDMSGWHRDDGDKYTDESGMHWKKCNPDDYIVYSEPQTSWSGEGLPPVGTVCEVVSPGYRNARFDRFVGKVVTVIAHDVIDADQVAVFRVAVNGQEDEQDYHAMVAKCFIPIRTHEQIAAEERENAITEMAESMAGYKDVDEPNDKMISLSTYLHDHGYRKMMADAEEVKA